MFDRSSNVAKGLPIPMGSTLNSRQRLSTPFWRSFRVPVRWWGRRRRSPWLRQKFHENAAPREGFQTTLVGEPFALGKHAMADSDICARIVLIHCLKPGGGPPTGAGAGGGGAGGLRHAAADRRVHLPVAGRSGDGPADRPPHCDK